MRRRILVAVIIVVGCGLSVLAGWLARMEEDRQLLADFKRRSDNYNKLVREVVGNFENGLFGLYNLFIGSRDVTREEFRVTAHEIRRRYSGITALEWVPIVEGSQRKVVESVATKELGQPFQFVTNQGLPAPEAAEYRPILFVEPHAGNERALGFDLNYGPTTHELKKAASTGEVAVSQRLRLIQESDADRFSIILIWPVFNSPGGEAECVGFVQGIFRISDLLGRHTSQTLDVMYLDPAATSETNRVLFFNSPTLGQSENPGVTEQDFRRGMHREVKLAIGNQQWLVLHRPNHEWLAQASTGNPTWLLLAGLSITGLLAGLMHVLGRRTETIEEEVERQTAELTESRRQLETLMHSLPGMAFRSSYGVNSRVLFMSDGALDMTGYAADDFVSGRIHPNKLIHPDDLAGVREKTKAAIADKTYFEMEYRIHHRSGEIKWALSRGRGVYTETGELRFIEGLVIDITDQKKAEADKLTIERLIQEGQKLESLGVLAGGVAHDFNNLLTTILGNAGLARAGSDGNQAIGENLRQIELATKHAAALCRQMLAYAGKGQLTKEPVDLVGVIEKIKPLLVSSIGSHVSLEINHAGDHQTKVFGDPTQLSQIALNLVLNAAEAMAGKPGRITLTTGISAVSAEKLKACVVGTELPAGKYVTLEVRDDGPGMPPATMKRIFEPFFSTKFEGRGLGLAAVMGIVRGHHGALHVTSQPGQGSCFTLILQRHDADSKSPLPQTTELPIALVVDDDEPVRNVTAELLNSIKYYPVLAASGNAAIELFRQDPDRYAVALIDCVMPDLSGEQTLIRLRAIRPDLPAIMMSGHTDRAHHLPRDGHAAVDFITKPFKRAELEQKLQALVETGAGT